MIRFRLREDDARYNAILTEMYLRIATSGAPPATVSEILRSFARLETMAFGEGLRQGAIAAVAAVRKAEDISGSTLLELHHRTYGEAHAPLARAESDLGLPLLQTETPIVFAPETLAEALAAGLLDPPVAGPRAREREAPDLPDLVNNGDDVDVDLDALEARLREQAPIDREGPDIGGPGGVDHPYADVMLPDEEGEGERRPAASHEADRNQRPDLVARIRDTLLALVARGVIEDGAKFANVVHSCAIEMQMPPSAVDDALTSPIGRAVLPQVGLPNTEVPPPIDSFASFVTG